mgnify:CR=1 FL=1
MKSITPCSKSNTTEQAANLTLVNWLKPPLKKWRHNLARWHMNWRTRRQLSQLDSHQLKDISISSSEAITEANKPFWKD